MKILKESKEKLPIDFITQFVSKGWDEVGNLKASINGIKKEFSGTKEVEDILQDLVDAYLIAIGQMELHLDKKDYVELPKEEKLKESLKDGKVDSHELEIIDKLISKFRNEYKLEGKELYDACIKAGMTREEVNAFVISDEELKEAIEAKKFEDNNKTEIFTELPDYDVEVEQKGKKIEIELEPKEFDDSELAMSDEEVARVNEPFDDEWPEPVGGSEDIQAAKAALANGELHIGEPEISGVESANNESENIENSEVDSEKEQEIRKQINVENPFDLF